MAYETKNRAGCFHGSLDTVDILLFRRGKLAIAFTLIFIHT